MRIIQVRATPDKNGKWIDLDKAIIHVRTPDNQTLWARILNSDSLPQNSESIAGILYLTVPLKSSNPSEDHPVGWVYVYKEHNRDPGGVTDPARMTFRTSNLSSSPTRDETGNRGENYSILRSEDYENFIRVGDTGITMSTDGSSIGIDRGGDLYISASKIEIPDPPQYGPMSKGQPWILDLIPKTIVTPIPAKLPAIMKIVKIVDGLRQAISNGSSLPEKIAAIATAVEEL